MGREIHLTSGDTFHFIQLIANYHALLCLPSEILGSLNPDSHVLIQRLLCPGVLKMDEALPPSLSLFLDSNYNMISQVPPVLNSG
jgi:hypothetical protein